MADTHANAAGPATGSVPAIEVAQVSHSYDAGSPRSVLDRVSLRVEARDFVGIIGPNGGGKTTLLRIILGIITPTEGTVRVFGTTPSRAARRIGYVPQRAAVNLAAPATVLDAVLMGRIGRSSWGFRYRAEDREAALEALALTDVRALADRPLEALSGGQRQRVLIARALCGNAELLLLDEPTAGVDAEAERGLTELLHRLNEHMPVVVVTHDIGFVSTHVRSVACLNRTLSLHRPQEVTGASLASMYGGGVQLVDHHASCRAVEHDHPSPD